MHEVKAVFIAALLKDPLNSESILFNCLFGTLLERTNDQFFRLILHVKEEILSQAQATIVRKLKTLRGSLCKTMSISKILQK